MTSPTSTSSSYGTSPGTTSNDLTSASPHPFRVAKPRTYSPRYNSFITTTSAICTGPIQPLVRVSSDRYAAAMLVVHGLTKSYAGPRPRIVFADVHLELCTGDYVAVMGESGIGKSTLLNLIAGLDSSDQGSIQIDGLELTALDD